VSTACKQLSDFWAFELNSLGYIADQRPDSLRQSVHLGLEIQRLKRLEYSDRMPVSKRLIQDKHSTHPEYAENKEYTNSQPPINDRQPHLHNHPVLSSCYPQAASCHAAGICAQAACGAHIMPQHHHIHRVRLTFTRGWPHTMMACHKHEVHLPSSTATFFTYTRISHHNGYSQERRTTKLLSSASFNTVMKELAAMIAAIRTQTHSTQVV
jgi:hypothetical protein